jgi:flagellar biosynthesis GTPase FlhF
VIVGFNRTRIYKKQKQAAIVIEACKYHLLLVVSPKVYLNFTSPTVARMIIARKSFRRLRDMFRNLPALTRGWFARKAYSKEISDVKERKRRLEEIRQKELNEQSRAQEVQEEQNRQDAELAQRAEEDKKKHAELRKKQEADQKKKVAEEERKKVEDKQQELKDLNQLEDITTLQDMLKAQELNHMNELNDIVGNMESFSFEKSAGSDGNADAYVYTPQAFSMSTETLDNLSLGELLMGLKKTVQAVADVGELDAEKFKISAELETEIRKPTAAASSAAKKTAAGLVSKLVI